MPRTAFERALIGALVAVPKARLRRRMNHKLSVLEGTIQTMETECARAERIASDDYVRIYDAALFVCLLNFDLSVAIYDQMVELRESRKNFYSRSLSLIVFEALEDLPAVFGKSFRSSLHKVCPADSIRTELNVHTKRLDDWRKTYSRELNEIRIFAAAHREQNARAQLAAIKKVNDDKITKLGRDLDDAIGELVVWLTGVVQEMGKPRTFLKHMKIPA